MQYPSNTSSLALRFFLSEFWLSLFQVQAINKCVCKSRLILFVILKKKGGEKAADMCGHSKSGKHYKNAEVEMVKSR